MYLDEFKKHIEENCNAQGTFLTKATIYLLSENENRKPASRWSDSRIEKEADKMWDIALKNLHDNLATNIKSIKDNIPLKDKWNNFLSEYEVLDNFCEGIDDLEFE